MRLAERVAVGVLLSAVAAFVALRWLYPRVLYPAPQRDERAAGAGEVVTLRAADGVTVHALSFGLPPAAPVLVYFHGNGVVTGDVAWMAREFVQRGLGVVACEYRGYGLSAGTAPSEAGLYADAEAVLAWLSARGVGKERIALLGESLGTGVAAEMAARGHATKLVLVTPYTAVTDVAAQVVPKRLAELVMRERFDTLSKATRISVPTLVLHGTRDEVIAYSHAERLMLALPRARIVTVPGGHHNDLFLGEGYRLFDEVVRFVTEPSERSH